MKRRVALIIETSSRYGRDLLAGVVRFMRTHEDWSVFLEQRDLLREPPAWLAGWSGDGILSRITTPGMTADVKASGVPLVELTDRRDAVDFPLVRSDDAAIGRLAAEHLLERGFRQFGFCGFEGEAWSDRRGRAFDRTIAEATAAAESPGAESPAAASPGADAPASCARYITPWHGPEMLPWEDRRRALTAWVEGLPKPVGVMACNDVRGMHLLDACAEAGFKVPEEVAVIGVDNDDLLCRVCAPPLSSVAPDAERVGHLAAEMLACLMAGRDPGPTVVLVPPAGVAARQSTDVVAIEEPEIAAALHFIRQHACRGLTVEDVLKEAAVSRSTLERKLRLYLGRSPQQEIRAVQIRKAKELLAGTSLPAERIAELCGYRHPEYLHVVFKRLTGRTPGEYRAETRPELA